MDLLDYFRWTIATAAGVAVPSHLGFDGEIGAGDLIHGGSGDDVIYGMGGDNVIFGHGGDDVIVGGYGNDWISGGVGDDGILGDDGVMAISRDSSAYGEPLYGIDPIATGELTTELAAPGPAFHDIINVEGELTHTARLFAFIYEFGGNDIAYGGLGSDSIHGGVGDDALSGAEALPGYFSGELNELLKATQGDGNTSTEPWFFDTAPFNPGDILQYQLGESAWFRLFNQLDPLRMMLVDSAGNRVDAADVDIALADSNGQNEIANVDYDATKWSSAATGEEVFDFFLNFDPNEGVLDTRFTTTDPQMSDGDDVIFGDLGNDWIVGGTGRDHVWGGADDDVLNVDDNHLTTIFEQQDPIANDSADPFQAYSDIGYGGIGRDALLANTGADRVIDWIGEFNSYSVPFNPFGGHQISRQISPGLREFLYELARADGADLLVGVERGGTPERNGEPFGETTVVTSADEAWAAQHGAPLDQQPGSYPGRRVLMLRELEGPVAGTLNVDSPTTTGGDTTLAGDSSTGTGDTATSDGGATGDGTGGDTETPSTGNNGNGSGGGNSNAGGNGGGSKKE